MLWRENDPRVTAKIIQASRVVDEIARLSEAFEDAREATVDEIRAKLDANDEKLFESLEAMKHIVEELPAASTPRVSPSKFFFAMSIAMVACWSAIVYSRTANVGLTVGSAVFASILVAAILLEGGSVFSAMWVEKSGSRKAGTLRDADS